MRSLFVAMIVSTGLAVGQAPSILPVYNYGLTELKTYLNLSDAQVQSLLNVQKAQQQATTDIYTQMNAKQTQLNGLLAANSTNATQIGQLTIDINHLRKQLPVSGEPYRSQALAVLTPDQKTRLAGLVAALQNAAAASGAVTYNLIDRPPATVQPRMLPALLTSEDAVLVEAQP